MSSSLTQEIVTVENGFVTQCMVRLEKKKKKKVNGYGFLLKHIDKAKKNLKLPKKREKETRK